MADVPTKKTDPTLTELVVRAREAADQAYRHPLFIRNDGVAAIFGPWLATFAGWLLADASRMEAELRARVAELEANRGVDPTFKTESDAAWKALGFSSSVAREPESLARFITELRKRAEQVTRERDGEARRADAMQKSAESNYAKLTAAEAQGKEAGREALTRAIGAWKASKLGMEAKTSLAELVANLEQFRDREYPLPASPPERRTVEVQGVTFWYVPNDPTHKWHWHTPPRSKHRPEHKSASASLAAAFLGTGLELWRVKDDETAALLALATPTEDASQ